MFAFHKMNFKKAILLCPFFVFSLNQSYYPVTVMKKGGCGKRALSVSRQVGSCLHGYLGHLKICRG